MPCYHPLEAWQRGAAAPLFRLPGGFGYRRLELPCGQCVGCRLERSRQWAVRCVHEAQMHDESCMLTLTYDESHLPSDLSLCHRDFQLFLKRLRSSIFPRRVRYYMCGEYGELNSRPHYHAIVFGFYPVDRVFFRKSDAGFNCYSSKSLDVLWKLGSVYVGDVTFESAAYVARYVMKKVGSDGVKREIFDVDTGEIFLREHEYSRMSLKPGIGAEWFSRFACDVFPRNHVVMRGVKCSVPRYYDTLLGRINPVYLAAMKAQRVDGAECAFKRLEDANSHNLFGDLRRLKVHEHVKLASLNLLKRS